jgi:hypothetical protein
MLCKTLHLCYEDHLIDAVKRNNQCLFGDLYEAHNKLRGQNVLLKQVVPVLIAVC